MLVALDGRPEWLAFAAGGYYAAYPALGARYHIPPRLQDAVAYSVPLVVVAAGWLIRNKLAQRAALAAEPVVTEPVVTEPVVTEPVVTEPVVMEPVVTVPVVPVPEGAVAEVAEPESVGREIPV
jgi:hypothetical protein